MWYRINYKHGDSNTRFYNIWSGIKSRTSNPKNKYFKNNIKICLRWEKYIYFKEDMYNSYIEHCKKHGEKNTTIDRINNKKSYSLENCRWATYKEQAINRRNTNFIKYKGETKCLKGWSEKLGIDEPTLKKRIREGWDIETAFNKKVEYRTRKSIQQKLTYKNKTKTIVEWAEEIGILPCTLRMRIKRGWSVEKALNKTNKGDD